MATQPHVEETKLDVTTLSPHLSQNRNFFVKIEGRRVKYISYSMLGVIRFGLGALLTLPEGEEGEIYLL